MRELALHLLDIAENSIAAQSNTIHVTVVEDNPTDRLKMSVRDDGIGMSPDAIARVIDPFVTSRTTRKVGLGIPLLKAAAEACQGGLQIQSTLGEGTLVDVEFQKSHIDRMPLGDLADTFLTLWVSNPQIHWIFQYQIDDAEFLFDDETIRQELQDCSRTEPEILTYFREIFEDRISEIQRSQVKIQAGR